MPRELINARELLGTYVHDPLLDPPTQAVNPLSELSNWTQDNPLFDLIAKFENEPLWLGLKNPSDPNAITSHKANVPVKGDDPTAGFGFKFKPDGTPYQAGEEVTAEEAEARLRTEGVGDALEKISRYVDPEVWGRMSDPQKRSVISLFHNVNEGSLAESDALRSLNAGNFQLFREQAYGVNGFNKAFGQVHSGLQARRAEEGALFDSEEAMPVSKGGGEYAGLMPVFFGNPVTPADNDIIDKIISLPRGFGKSFARMVAAEIPEGLWALADLATNLSGFENVLDERESAFLDRLQEIRDKIGYEESRPGKLGEALGSMVAFVAGGWATGGLKALTAVPKLLKGGNYGKALLNTWYGTLPGQTFAVGEQNLRMKAARESGIDYDEGQRNSALALAIPVGMLEYAAWFPLMRGLSKKVVSPDYIQRIIGMTSEAALTGGVEGAQEVIAGLLQDSIEKNIYNPDIGIGESWAEEFGYGAGAGAIFDLVLNIANRKGRKFDDSGDPDDLLKPLPEEELAEVEDEVLGTGPIAGVRDILHGTEEIDLDPFGTRSRPVDVGTTQEDIDLVGQGQVEAEAARQRGEVVDAAPDIVVEEEISEVKEPAVIEEEVIEEEVIEEAPPVEVKDEPRIVIPTDVKVGDEVDMFDAAGNPYKARVTAVSETGALRVINQQGEDVLVEMHVSAVLDNVNNPNYEFKSIGPKFRQATNNKRKVVDLTEQEMVSAESVLEEIYNDVPNQGAGLSALQDLNAIRLARKRIKSAEEAAPVKVKGKAKKYINYKEQLKDHPFVDLQEEKVLPLIEEGFVGETKIAAIASGYSDFVRTNIESTNSITPLEARKILTHINEMDTPNVGGTEGWIDRIFESELIEVALGKEPKSLESFWVGSDTSIDDSINNGKVSAQQLLDMVLSKNPKPMSIKNIKKTKKAIERLNQQGAFFQVEEDGTLTSIKDKSKFLIDEETALSIYPQESAEVIPIETAKPKAKPTKRVPLVTTFTNPVNNKKVVATFSDEDSVRVYNDLNKETRRVKGIKTKPKKESSAFRQYIKDKYGLNTNAYAKLVADYKKKVKDDVLKAQEAGVTEIQPISFSAFVEDQIGGASPGDIERELSNRNISTSDKAFKRWLEVNTGVDDLNAVAGLKRRELMRQMTVLPVMDKKNSSIDSAFNLSRENTEEFSKQEAITNRAKKLNNKHTSQELILMAAASGVPSQNIYDKKGMPFTGLEIARAIARKDINSMTTAEENVEKEASQLVPNVLVRKVKARKADKAKGLQPYRVEFPDKTPVRVLLPEEATGQPARNLASQIAVEERTQMLEQENIEKKVAPEAASRDYAEAVRLSLMSGANPLAILQEIAGPQVKLSTTPAMPEDGLAGGIGEDLPMPDKPYVMAQGNLYAFKDNIDAPDFVMNLRRIAKRVFPDANVAAVDRLFNAENMQEVAGVTIGDMVVINLETGREGRKKFASPEDTLFHEAVHYFVNNGYFNDDVIQVLRENEDNIRNIALTRLGTDAEGNQIVPESFEEAVAIASGVYNEARLNGKIPYQFHPPLRRFFEPIFRFFNGVGKYFSGKKYRRIEDIFDAIGSGQLYRDASEAGLNLNPANKAYIEGEFRETGWLGSYTGGPLAQQFDPEVRKPYKPLFSRTLSVPTGKQLTDVFTFNALKNAALNTSTKQTQASNWIAMLNKVEKSRIGGDINSKYFIETGLDEWLEGKGNEQVTKQEIIDYLNRTTGIYSVQMYGEEPVKLIPITADEKIAFEALKKAKERSAQGLLDTENRIRNYLKTNDKATAALHKFYEGPVDGRQSAFYTMVHFPDVKKEYEAIKAAHRLKRGATRKEKIPPVEWVTEKEFEHLKKAFNPSYASVDFLYSREQNVKTNNILNKLLKPLVREGDKGYEWAGPKDSPHLKRLYSDIADGYAVDENWDLNYIVADPLIAMLDKLYMENWFKARGTGIGRFKGDNVYLWATSNGLDPAFGQLLSQRAAYKESVRINEALINADNPFNLGFDPKLIDYINLKPLEWEGSTIAGDALIMDAENEQSVFTGFSLETMDQHYDPIQKMLIRARKVPDWQAIEALTNLNYAGAVLKIPAYEDQVYKGRAFDYGPRVQYENPRDFVFTYSPAKGTEFVFANQHFPLVPNAFMNIRTADVYDAEANKYLLIEEIQSDYYTELQRALRKYHSLQTFNKEYDALKEPEQNQINNIIRDTTKEQFEEALSQSQAIADTTRIPLMGFPKPDFNAWQDFGIRFAMKLANDNGYNGIALTTTKQQAERNTYGLVDTFDSLSFYASVDPASITRLDEEGVASIGFEHGATGQVVTAQTLIDEGYLTEADNRVHGSGLMAASQYFGRLFSQDTNSDAFKYVDHVRLVGMQGPIISKDLTVSLGADSFIMEHEGSELSNYQREGTKGLIYEETGSVGSILPPAIAEIIQKQIYNGVQPQYSRSEINVALPQEIDTYTVAAPANKGDDRTLSPMRLLIAQDSAQGINNGYINLRKISPNLIERFFAKKGWQIYDNQYWNKLQKQAKKYDPNAEVQGAKPSQLAKDLYDADITQINSLDYWAERKFDAPYEELTEGEQQEVTQDRYVAQSRIQEESGMTLLLSSAFDGKRRRLGAKKHESRFKVHAIKFESNDQVQPDKVTPQYSSTPADAQKASIWRKIMDYLGNLTAKFSGFGTLPHYKKYLTERYKAFGDVGDARRTAKYFYDILGPLLNPRKGDRGAEEYKRNRREFNSYFLGGWDADPNVITDTKLRTASIEAKEKVDRIGRNLVQRGLLKRELYEENRGTYLPRLYMKYILDHPEGRPFDYLKHRKDLDETSRMIMGDIEELSPEYRVRAGIEKPLRDVAMLDFFNTVSQQEGWAIIEDDIMVALDLGDGNTQNVSALWLKEEAERLREQAAYFEPSEPEAAASMIEAAQEYEELSAPAIARTNLENVDTREGYRRIPNTRQYGMLKGVPVRKEIYNDVIGSFTLGDVNNAYSKWIALMKKGTSIWKTLKVPLNPPTVVRNVGSNMILMNLVGGIPIHKVIPRMSQAINDIRNNGKYWQIAQKYGIDSTGFSNQELYQTNEAWLDLMEEKHPLGDITRFFNMPNILFKRLLKKGGDIYQFTESVGKTAVIMDAMENQGMDEIDAFHLAQKALFDYSLIPEAGRQFRQAPIGMPFFTFYYKAFPALIEVAVNNPMRYLPYIALSAGLTALSSYAFGFEDDEEKRLQKSLEPWLARRTGVYVLPWKDSDGRFQFLDVGYFFPWNMYFDAVKAAGNGEFLELQRTTGLFSGPFSDILLAMKTNRDPFTQRVIWDERDPMQDRVKSLMWYTYSLGMPSWLTPNGAISKTVKAFQDTPRPTGQPADTVPQALLRFVGVNAYGLEPRETRARNIKRLRQDIKDTQQRMKWTMKNQSLDQDTKNARRIKYLALIREKQQLLQNYIQDTALPESLLNRKSKLQ